jgi:hypothetical protein
MISLFYRHAVSNTMDYLKRHLNDYEDATQKEPKAKRALIHTLYEVLSIAEIVEKEVKDKATFDGLFENSVTKKTKFTKALAKLSEHLNIAKRDMDVVRNDRKKRGKHVKPTVVAGGGNIIVDTGAVITTLPPDEDPAAVKSTKASKTIEGKTGKKPQRHGKDKITPAMREEIWDKYIGDKSKALCPVCQTSLIKSTKFSAGHIVAEAAGGVTNITNLVPICGHCNSRMSTDNLFEYTQKNHMRAPVFPGLDAEGDEAVGDGKTKKGEGKKSGGGK